MFARNGIAVSIAVASIIALAGCSGAASAMPSVSGGAPAATTGAPAAAKPANYGNVVGTGEIGAVAGAQYEKIAVSPQTLAIAPGPGDAAGDGWTAAQKLDARNFAMKYTVEQFLDSNVLEGGEPAFTEWKNNEGRTYMVPEFDYSGVMALLGNIGGHNAIPALVHDGKPREASVSLVPSFSGASDFNGPALTYAVLYDAKYRVDDHNAAYAGGLENHMSPEQFLASDKAKDTLKDNKGENLLGAYGQIELTMRLGNDGKFKIAQTNFRVDFDTSDFSKAPVSPKG